jgi:hypothetical protein
MNEPNYKLVRMNGSGFLVIEGPGIDTEQPPFFDSSKAYQMNDAAVVLKLLERAYLAGIVEALSKVSR